MRIWKKRQMLMFLSMMAFIVILTGCGSKAPEGELTLINEQGEEVTLTNKERATILFHFTGVG